MTTAAMDISARLRTKLLLLEPEFRGATTHMWRPEGLLERYRTYLCTMHAVIRASVPLMELALRRMADRPGDPLSGPLTAYLAEHIQEEAEHDAWLLEDLRAAGAAPRTRSARCRRRMWPPWSAPSTTGSSTTTPWPCSAISRCWRGTRPRPG